MINIICQFICFQYKQFSTMSLSFYIFYSTHTVQHCSSGSVISHTLQEISLKFSSIRAAMILVRLRGKIL